MKINTFLILIALVNYIFVPQAFAKKKSKAVSTSAAAEATPATPSPSAATTNTSPTPPAATSPSGAEAATSSGTATASPTDTATESSDKLNVDQLEKKYWSSKDDDFTVVQNRSYTKAKRFFLSLQTGKLINDGFSESSPTAISFGYFFNEKLGIELDSQQFKTKDNSVTQGFLAFSGVYPDFNRPRATNSIGCTFVPIYAKVSLLEKKIMYLDLAFTLSLGKSDYEMATDHGGVNKSATNYGITVTQNWFLTNNFAFRFDLRNKWANEEKMKYQIKSGASEATRSLGTSPLLDTTWQFGFTYFH